MLRFFCVLTIVAIAGASAGAQATTPRPAFDAFEVATIKPTAPDARGRFIRMQSAQHLQAQNHALRTLIAAAYNLHPSTIAGGPAWVDSDHYDILAKTPGDVRPTPDEQMQMLRSLLAERFKLKFHREEKELPVYALTLAKGAPKLMESTMSPDASPEGPPPLVFVISPQQGGSLLVSLPGKNATMGELASVMQRAALDRPVIDRTALTAQYDFILEFTPDETQFGGAFTRPANSDEPAKPDLFAAMQQQLGLRLEATRGPVNLLVIDRAERPTEN